MRISHRYRFVFFSNPKTGSESVRALLDPYSDICGVPMWEMSADNPFYSHISPREVRQLFAARGWPYDDYCSFTFVRSPWARLVSLYQMIYEVRGGRLQRWSRRLGGLLKPGPSHPSIAGFRAWLRTIQPDGIGGGGPPNQRWQRYGTYSLRAYAADDTGNLLVRRIVRLEHAATELPEVLREIGLPDADRLSMPRVNARRHRPYVEYYDDPSAELVARMYADDIARFEYRFGG